MRRQQGVTLVELLVALAVLAVLVGVVFPGFRAIVERNQLATTANRLVLAVSYARSEALRLGGGVELAAAAAGWDAGWEVREAGGNRLRVFEELPGRGDAAPPLSLEADPDNVDVLSFDSRGALVGGTGITFTLCRTADGANDGILVTVTPIGRVDSRPIGSCG